MGMTLLDDQICKVPEYVEELRSRGRAVTVSDAPPISVALPVAVGKGAHSGLVLRGDTWLELGNPEAGSCSCTLFTATPGLVRDGRVTVIGPDVSDACGKSLPFGQILLIGGDELQEGDCELLMHMGVIGDSIEGYMVRSSRQSVWSRISRDVALKGFTLKTLGRALRTLHKAGSCKIQAMETIFVTSSREDLERLAEIAREGQMITREIARVTWKARGVDLDCTLDCSSCADKTVCDDIKELLGERVSAS